MKKGLLFGLFLVLLFSVKPLWASIDTAYVCSQHYTVDSTRFFLVVTATTGNDPCWVGSSNVTDSLNFIQLDVCYYDGMITSTCTRTDSFNLGVKQNGLINILAVFKYFLPGAMGGGQCVSPHFTKDSFDFTVNTKLTDIPQFAIQNPQFSLFPNPTTNQLNITIDESLVGAQLNIYSVTGALVQTAQLQTQHAAFNTQQFPSGVYIAEIKTRDASIKRKWVKM